MDDEELPKPEFIGIQESEFLNWKYHFSRVNYRRLNPLISKEELLAMGLDDAAD